MKNEVFSKFNFVNILLYFQRIPSDYILYNICNELSFFSEIKEPDKRLFLNYMIN